MPAAPVHHTAVDKDGSWDGPAAEKAFDGTTQAQYDDLFAWVADPGSDPLTKSDGWGPHHEVGSDGKAGKANLKGVEAAMAALNGAHGANSTIPEATRAAVHSHLAAHYKDAGVDAADVPELKAYRAAGDNCNRCTGSGSIDLTGQQVECPQCTGTGTGANNADDEAKARAQALAAKAMRATLRGVPEKRVAPRREWEMREVPNGTGGTDLLFTGFASVTTPGDDTATYEMEDWMGPWVESVTAGAFAKTLSESPDTAFLLNHDGMTLARTKPGTLKLAEYVDPAKSPIYGVLGLHSEAKLDPTNFYVVAMRSAVERGDLDEMSFAFRVTRQEWNGTWDRRWINEVNIDKGDVSLVNFGANPITGGTVSMRQRTAGNRTDRGPAQLVAAVLTRAVMAARVRELREGKVLSAANEAALQEALAALHEADTVDIPGIVLTLQGIDTAVDAGMAAVSAVLGTANPDGTPDDLEPTLEPPEPGTLALPPWDASAERLKIERARYAPGLTGGARNGS